MKEIVLFTLLIVINSVQAKAIGGDVEGNGGNRCARDFARMGRIIYDVLQRNDFYRQNINMSKLNAAISNASISVMKGRLQDRQGGTVPVANDGHSKIYLSYENWCNQANYVKEAAIVLHEYLGIAMPGRDQQYQLSGSLYSRLGLSNDNFYTFMETGTDYETEKVTFKISSAATASSITLDTESIKEYYNVISIHDANRYQKRAEISCEFGKESLRLYSLYALYDRQRSPEWYYKASSLQTYKFTSSQQCRRFVRKASLGEVSVVLGMDSLTVVAFQ